MQETPTLPLASGEDFFEVRLESIGGLGANLAGQMLAEAGMLGAGLNGAQFSSYGSEKKGTPVKSFVRFCAPQTEVRTSSPVEQPHVIAVFHVALLRAGGVLAGLRPGGIAILNSPHPPEDFVAVCALPKGCRLATVDGTGIAVAERSRVNTAMLGAVTAACSFLPPDVVRAQISKTFGKKYPALVESNVRTFDRGMSEMKVLVVEDGPEYTEYARPEPLLGYLTQRLGGVVGPGTSIYKDLSLSRQGWLPELIRDKCIDCAKCEMVCPDYCFVWESRIDAKGRRQPVLAGIDYQYCKGCMKCIEACPTEALVKKLETEGWAEENRVAHHFQPVLPETTQASAERSAR
ncbi:MAG: 2-oxoacid:acceptor oxidoreductase family protein [Actinomycetota bacterium]